MTDWNGGFKSDRCGIEIWCPFHRYIDGVLSSNQTVAGLKFVDMVCFVCPGLGFKSDRCGIEMEMCVQLIDENTMFKSDRCGIEIVLVAPAWIFAHRVQIRPLRD